ncbi:hypothetical protein BJX76DRAFT_338836 [Aspergillus varians]
MRIAQALRRHYGGVHCFSLYTRQFTCTHDILDTAYRHDTMAVNDSLDDWWVDEVDRIIHQQVPVTTAPRLIYWVYTTSSLLLIATVYQC